MILSEAINEFNHDTNYRVRLIHTFKMTSSMTTVRSVWILGNLCRCPLLLPGKQYLLMGQLGMHAGSTDPIAEISQKSYVEEWKESMIRRLPDLKQRCPLSTTQMSTLVTNNIGSTTGTLICLILFNLVINYNDLDLLFFCLVWLIWLLFIVSLLVSKIVYDMIKSLAFLTYQGHSKGTNPFKFYQAVSTIVFLKYIRVQAKLKINHAYDWYYLN